MYDDQKNTSINTMLRNVREAKGITAKATADHLGITTASLSRLELGQAKVSVDRFLDVAGFFGVSATELLKRNIVSSPSTMDLNRISQIVANIQRMIVEMNVNPSPEKVGALVVAVYKQQIEAEMSGKTMSDEDMRSFVELVISD